MQTLVTFVFKFLAALPLAWLHKLGNLLGSLGFRVLSKDRQCVFENMKLAGLNPTDEAVKKVFRETAKGGLELPVAFFRRPEYQRFGNYHRYQLDNQVERYRRYADYPECSHK